MARRCLKSLTGSASPYCKWEWTSSWFGDYPGGELKDYSEAQQDSDSVDRGGSWRSYPAWLRSASRFWLAPDDRIIYLGFRVVAHPPNE